MALYTLKSEDEAMNPELYKNRVQGFAGLGANSPELQLFNMFGRNSGGASQSDDNFFAKKGKSIENALGTTGAFIAGGVDVGREDDLNKKRQEDAKKSIEDIIKSHGYNSKDEFYDASDKAEREIFGKYGFDSDDYWNKHAEMWSPAKANDKDVLDLEATRQDVINRMSQEDADTIRKFDSIQDEIKGQSKKNADIADKAAKDWEDYRENSYIGQKTNQDRGKFLGSAINTLSTASDVMLPGAGVVFNTVQGGVEGIADELEQNGLKNFDWNRAGQNALSGALTGAVVGGVNKGINNALAKRGGNLLKGGNKLTRAINSFNANNPIGQIGSTLASGATRGAVSGAVGGATGAGLGAAMNGQDVLGSALQGAVRGAQQGATTGGIMAGVNMAASKTPGVGDTMRQLNEAGEDWNNRKAQGESFRERLANTKNSGDSVVGNFLNDPKQSLQKLADKLPAPGMIVKDVSGDGMLNLEKGDTLPLQARIKTLEEMTDGQYRTIGDLIDDGITLDDIKAVLPKADYETLVNSAREIADINRLPYEALYINGKSDLPILNREQYYEDTLGKVKGNKYVSYKDVPDYMKNHLSNNTNVDSLTGQAHARNDETLRALFNDNTSSLSDLYERYERLAQGANQNEIFTPENIDNGLALAGKQGEKIANTIANKLFGGAQKIGVDNNSARKQNVKVKSMTTPEDIKNMKINDGNKVLPGTTDTGNAGSIPPRNPATELYDSLNRQPQEPIDLTSSFGDKGLGSIEQRNKLQALGQQLQNSAKTQKYAPIYDSLDAKTAKRAAETNAPQQLADLGVKPQDYNEYAKTSSYVNRVVSDLAKKSGVKVNAPDLPAKLSADNIDVVMSDSALKKYNGYIKQIVPDGDSPTQYSASYLLEKSRELGNKAANLRGNTDDVSALRQALTDAKYTLRDIATNALEGSLVTGDATNDMIAQGLKNLGANEKVQDYYTEAVDGKAPSVSDYIRRSSLFEQARDMGTQVDAEKYTRSASKAPTRFATKVLRASGLEQPIETLLRNTVAPVASGITNAAGKAIEGAGNIVANRAGSGGAETTTVPASTNAPSDYNPSTRLYNAIGRTEGLTNAEQARNAGYLANTAQEAEIIPNTTPQNAMMPTEMTARPTASTALYNSVGNGNQMQANTMANQTNAQSGNKYFPTTGDYWSDMIGEALSRAIDNDDVTAFAALFPMYKEAMSNVSKQSTNTSESSTAGKKLTATQQRANAAMNSLERISNMEPDLGYNLSGIPVIGNIATLGGNDYEAEAKSLAQQIGYMVSGANIKEEEAYNIGKAYVPQPFDSESTRRNKLQRAYEVIQQYQNGYAEE